MRKISLTLLVLAGCRAAVPGPALLPEFSLPTVSGGLQALEAKVQACLHNLANANTDGYKARRIVLMDVPPPRTDRDGPGVHTGLDVGGGVVVSIVVSDMSPGLLEVTGRTLDLALAGRGFFQVRRPGGCKAYTRCGSFCIDANGRLVTRAGYIVEPETTFPENVLTIRIGPDGTVSVKTASSHGSTILLGQLLLARFMDPESLRSVGSGLFEATDIGSGAAIMGKPGDSTTGLGTILQGHLERSNVDLAEESRRLTQLRRQIGLFHTLFAPELASGRIVPASFHR